MCHSGKTGRVSCRALSAAAAVLRSSHKIDPDLYTEYDVKRGLRDSNGNGVLTGLTKISDVVGYDVEDGEKKVPAAGRLFENIIENCGDWENEEELAAYLTKILNQQTFDRKGLIYGIGHAIYTESDPRAVILKNVAEKLAWEKRLQEEFKLYDRVERLSKPLVAQYHRLFKPICANVDFYSGLIYRMLGIPKELFTSIFAISRLAGWSAHRLEELVNQGKMIRPAYQYVGSHKNLVR